MDKINGELQRNQRFAMLALKLRGFVVKANAAEVVLSPVNNTLPYICSRNEKMMS